jgi:hypothetical protein
VLPGLRLGKRMPNLQLKKRIMQSPRVGRGGGMPNLRLGKRAAMEHLRLGKRSEMTTATFNFITPFQLNQRIQKLLANREFAEKIQRLIGQTRKRGHLVNIKWIQKPEQAVGLKRSGMPNLRLGKRSGMPNLRLGKRSGMPNLRLGKWSGMPNLRLGKMSSEWKKSDMDK